ncbi:hypothetical protein IV203_034913 [Nitzschia inconspicua]|uniref:Uncharacterized protein n=1 Tax=Nitzschia inconspicua TaxID=303405 RepID=A0A9K3PU28_9STRA|nr:hypothetical protein IV203_034913 [Nitzschia inconspicua]
MNATVHTLLKFHISCHQGHVLQEFKDKVESYVQATPNVWDSVLFFRLEDIDANNEVVTYRLAVRSRFTWQISNRVFQGQADLHKFCITLSFRLGINYDSPNPRTIMYFGGSLVDGGVQDYKANVLQNDNISNENDIITGLVPKDLRNASVRGKSQLSLDDEEKAPRYATTAMESRAMEQQTQETNDDEMESGSVDDQSPMRASEEDEDPGADDANKAFLNLLKKSHGA